MSFYASIGKKPIRLHKALAGHAANRLQAAVYKEMLYLIQQGVLSVADADIAVCYGPGLRWGVMGQSLQWHLGGRRGRHPAFYGTSHASSRGHDERPQDARCHPALKQTIIDGVSTEAKGRPVEQLAKAENDVLLGLLALRASAGNTLP